MSFYGSIYYQLVDAFNRIWITNKGKEKTAFPEEEKIEEKFEYHSPGRQGVIGLNSGNRWISFTGEEDNTFTIWHNSADGEMLVPDYGFYKIDNMHYVIPEEGEAALDAIARVIDSNNIVPGCRALLPIGTNGNSQLYESYVYEITGWKKEEHITDEKFTILSPDDFFVTTQKSEIDEAGHVIPGLSHLYKMPKSDVTEQIEKLWESVEKINELDEKQQESIDQHEQYVGDWSANRGYTFEQYDEEGNPTTNHWVPTISMAIGDMIELITGNPGNMYDQNYWKNKDVNLVRAIGNLTELYTDLGKDEQFGLTNESKLTDVNLIKVILYLKNKLIAANTTAISGHTGQLINLTDDINRLTADTLILQGRADDLEAKDIEIEADIDAINDPSTGILITAKNYTDSLANSAVKTNTEAITAINHPDTGILANAKSYTDNLANGAVKDNTNDIAAINHAETGILANANKYTDNLANGAVKDNANAITAIHNSETGILKTANNYTDAEIDKLNYTDSAAADGQYVYSVNETNGIITVEHKALPTYTLTSGKSDGTVAFNGDDVIVSGLKSAAYTTADSFDPAGAAATAKTEAITEAENQIQALTAEGGAIQVNAKAIEDLQKLLEGYGDLVAKVADLEQRIIALESPSSEEPENGTEPEPDPDPDPTPEESIDDPETT